MLKYLFALALVCALKDVVRGAEPEKSVVQITVFIQQPVWDAPWRFDQVRKASGTGFVIKGKRIMTNAHVVSWAKQVMLHRYQDPRPYPAHVLYIGHDCDLALLEVEDESFFKGMEALEIGELPQVRSTVVTYGYPAGGEQISYTRGVVSRIEMQSYAQIGNRAFLAVQTDAAINPGNSGGPVIQDDKVVGVAFQGIPGLENTGFFIPPPLMNHFLKDVEDKGYDGFPQAGIRLVALQNPAYRRALKMPDNDLGARIDYVFPVGESRKLLQQEDVLLKVGNYDVGSDGSIIYRGNRVFAGCAFNESQQGEKMPLTVWRKGEALSIDLPMHVYKEDRREGNQYELPRYYIFGGMVFTPLSRDYLRTLGAGWTDGTSSELVYELYYRRQESAATARKEPVVLATTLAHAINANLEVRQRTMVDKINGVRIDSMEDVVRAFESGPAREIDVIEFHPDHNLETIHHSEALQAADEIMRSYGIIKDRRL